MPHQDTIFGQLLKLVPRHEFDQLAEAHHAGAKLRAMTRWSQFVAMTTAHLARRFSLCDVVANLKAQAPRLYHLGARPVARSSLARVNEEQPWEIRGTLEIREFGGPGDRIRGTLYLIHIACPRASIAPRRSCPQRP